MEVKTKGNEGTNVQTEKRFEKKKTAVFFLFVYAIIELECALLMKMKILLLFYCKQLKSKSRICFG
jgi:hypothetical protein